MSNRNFWIISAAGFAIVFALVTWLASGYYIDRKIQFVSERLALLGELRGATLEEYFATAEAELRFWSTDAQLEAQIQRMSVGIREYRAQRGDPEPELRRMYIDENPYPDDRARLVDVDGGYYYNAWHSEFHPLARLFVTERGYYDFFLVLADGTVIYTAEKEADYATNLLTGPWRETGLAEVFRRAMDYAEDGEDEVAVSDFAPYEPSAGAPAAFMAKAVHGEDGELMAVIAMQLPTDEVQRIMQVSSGMGQSGETYLVGEDLLMRSDSRFSEEPTILKVEVDTGTVRAALAGESGVRFTEDYRGVEVLSAYTLAEIDDNRWAVMAEMDRAEILEVAAAQRPALGGLMLFFYGLSLWSLWFVRNADLMEGGGESLAMSDLFDTDLGDSQG